MKTAVCLMLILMCFTALPQASASGNVTAAAPQPATPMEQALAINARIKAAMLQVMAIVNQPVTPIQRGTLSGSLVSVTTYGPGGWFHEGAIIPDYNKVDVRTTRELPYEKDIYVTSDMNPGVVFNAKELEFNPSTKYFYTDRKYPKKKLTEAEMLKINALYREIGSDEQQLNDVKAQAESAATIARTVHSPYMTLAILAVLLLVFVACYITWFR